MVRYRSKYLKFLGYGCLSFPVLYPVMAALLFDVPGNLIVRVLLSPFFLALTILFLVLGYAFLEMRRWVWPFFVMSLFLIAYENAFVLASYGTTNHVWFSFLFSIAVLVGLYFRTYSEVRVPYFLPRIRWWESNPRYRMIIPAKIHVVGKSKAGEWKTVEILDLSGAGCFIKNRDHHTLGSTVEVEFEVFGQKFVFTGELVWNAMSTVTHPQGMGIKFTVIAKKDRKRFKAVEKRLMAAHRFYRSSRVWMGQAEFSQKMGELMKLPLTVKELKETKDGKDKSDVVGDVGGPA